MVVRMISPPPGIWFHLLALFFLSGITSAQTAASDVEVEKNVMVSMRDGVKLATDIYRPVSMSGKLPVILTRLPYNKNGAQKQGEYFARHGYVFVAQDTRGRYASDGVWHWMTDDAPDGVDCAKWIIRQSWSDGK